jgi:hypothetical protein
VGCVGSSHSELLIRRDSGGRREVIGRRQAASRPQDRRRRSGLMIAVTVALPGDRDALASLAQAGSLVAGGCEAGIHPCRHRLRDTAQGNRRGCAEARSLARSLAAGFEHRRSHHPKRREGLRGDSSCECRSHSRVFPRCQRGKRASESRADQSKGGDGDRAVRSPLQLVGRWCAIGEGPRFDAREGRVERSVGRRWPTLAQAQCDEARRLQDRHGQRTARVAKGWRARQRRSEEL